MTRLRGHAQRIHSAMCSTKRAMNGPAQCAPPRSPPTHSNPWTTKWVCKTRRHCGQPRRSRLRRSMNAGTQRAEQKALYAAADRRLAAGGRILREARDSGARSIRRQHARRARRQPRRLLGSRKTAVAIRRNGARQPRRREQAKSLGNLAAVHNRLGLHGAGGKGIRGAAAPDRSRRLQPYQYAVLLGNYRFHADRARRLRSRSRAAHARRSNLYTQIGEEDERAIGTGGARRILFPHG